MSSINNNSCVSNRINTTCKLLAIILCFSFVGIRITEGVIINDSGPYYGTAIVYGFVMPSTGSGWKRMIYAEFDTKKLKRKEKEDFVNVATNFIHTLCNDKRINVTTHNINNKIRYDYHFKQHVDVIYKEMMQLIQKGVPSDKFYPYLYSTDEYSGLVYIDAVEVDATADSIMGDPYCFCNAWC